MKVFLKIYLFCFLLFSVVALIITGQVEVIRLVTNHFGHTWGQINKWVDVLMWPSLIFTWMVYCHAGYV